VDPTNVAFLIKVKPSGQKLPTKFAGRYAAEAHQHLADAGMAPWFHRSLLDGEHGVGNRFQGSTERGGLYVGSVRTIVMQCVEENVAEKESLVKGCPRKYREGDLGTA
jgi:hypothetical protein